MEDTNAAIIEKINELKKKHNAIVVAHNFQLAEVQDIADYVGDAMDIIRTAVESEADVIIFCGVTCMAETAAMLCPEKVVILPDLNAGCTLSNMITIGRFNEKREKNPDATVVSFINVPPEVKAEADILCTAVDAIKTIEEMPADKEIMFIPDQYLGDYVAGQADRELILWPGYCSTHVKIRPEDVEAQKEAHPDAKVVAHLLCIPQVKALADIVTGTKGMLEYARETDAKEIIVATEIGLLHRLQKENPEKTFIIASERAVCATMKIIKTESILWSLENMGPRVEVSEEIIEKAKAGLETLLKE
ncbi:quinolinate synthase NadA [Chloroflexota bacterium]